jgi:hypothetical protein
MNLILQELNTELVQAITTTKILNLYAFRLHLYKQGNPSGSLFVRIKDAQGGTIADSEPISISSISNADYFHGYVRFLISYPLKINTEYFISLKQSGYSFSESAFIGWVQDLGLQRVTATYSPNTSYNSPLGLEVWAYEHLIRGE